MNAKMLTLLRICALVLGWLLVVGIVANVWGHFVVYRQAQMVPMAFPQFNIATALGSFFSNFGNAFFAFLIAAVFRMIERQAPVGHENARRLMIVCCLSYVADALVRSCAFAASFPGTLQSFGSFGWRFWIPYASTAIPVLVPILFAASIFVLYTHFSKMVTFESEVA